MYGMCDTCRDSCSEDDEEGDATDQWEEVRKPCCMHDTALQEHSPLRFMAVRNDNGQEIISARRYPLEMALKRAYSQS